MARRNCQTKNVDADKEDASEQKTPVLEVPDLDKLPPSAALTTKQTASSGKFAETTLKKWRQSGGKRGPRVTYIDGYPRYLVRDVREWLGLPVTSQQMGA